VDILQKLGLKGEKPSRSVPAGVIPFRSGIILNQRAHIESPLRSVFPAAVWPSLALVLSVRSHRLNSAFLFTVLSGRKKLLLGLQLTPSNLVLHTGPNTSVSLPYEPHDGQWHQLAVGINGQRVTLYASCGEQIVHADFGWDSEEGLAPELQGSFLLGRTSQQQASAHFEGAICQFDLVPSAEAAHNYCRYIKKQCREADTYRPNLPPLLPILPQGKNVTATAATPKRGGPETPKKTTGISLARSVAAAASAVRYVAPTQTIKPSTGTIPTPFLGTVMPVTVQLGLASPPPKGRTETVTAPLRTKATPTKAPNPTTSKVLTQKPTKPTPPKPSKKMIAGTDNKKPTIPATTSTKPSKIKPDSTLSYQGTVLKKPQPTTAKKTPPKPKVTPSKATPLKPKTNPVKVVPSKPTKPKVNPSKPTVSKTTTAKTSKPVTKQVIKPTKQSKTTKATVIVRPTRPSDNPVTPPATDGFLSWEVPPTLFSMLEGLMGEKGDAGPPGLSGPPGKTGLLGKKGPRVYDMVSFGFMLVRIHSNRG
ncbi:collagen alpha-1(XXVII) chain A-like, partial [Notothenia coriiceps]|uniref:Collagen alpha-1(XXVII) chain A-like n=1 Tax=Notothenia coriiceps TaxID=8208 RepID=A0A6I9NFX9_9TELE